MSVVSDTSQICYLLLIDKIGSIPMHAKIVTLTPRSPPLPGRAIVYTHLGFVTAANPSPPLTAHTRGRGGRKRFVQLYGKLASQGFVYKP
jgi:hypothetical protein